MSKASGQTGLGISSQAEIAQWVHPGPRGYALFRNKVIQTARNEDFIVVSLLAIVGLLVSARLAMLLDIPGVEGLLQMPL